MKDLKKLTAIFKRLGAKDPKSWATSEVNEDLPQLARFVFLRSAWNLVVGDRDTKWINASQKAYEPGEPCSGIAPALKRALAKGVDPEDLTEIVRVMQYELLFGLCALIDDPSSALDDLEEVADELEDIGWTLTDVDEDGEPGREIGLHSSVLSMDPTGREMRPEAS